MRQAYTRLSEDGAETRIRNINDKVFQQTRKTAGTLQRGEETNDLDISLASFNAIVKNDAKGNVIDKTRYDLPLEDGVKLELDIYHGALEGLVTGEVEFKGRDAHIKAQSWSPPAWLTREVTEDDRFKNKRLAAVDSIKTLLNDRA